MRPSRIASRIRTSAALLMLLALAPPAWGQEQEGGGAPVEHDWITLSAQVGAGGSKAWNYAGASLEVFPGQNHLSFYIAGGLGTILLGAGAALYSDRDDTGLFISATGGLVGAHAQVGGQLKVLENLFLSGGLGYGSYFLQHEGYLPFAGLEWRL